MTFEEWKHRPVYIVQVYTARIAIALPGWHKLRVVNPFKRAMPTAVKVRGRVAEIVRQKRRDGLTRQEVRNWAKEIIASPWGTAVRLDLCDAIAEARHD